MIPVPDSGATRAVRPVLALDLGGTQLRTAVALPDGTLLGRRTEPTPRAAATIIVEACVRALKLSLADADAQAPRTLAPVAIGMSAPGPLDPQAGTLIDPPNLDRSLWGFPLAARIGAELDLPVALERDTHVAALAEGRFGAARGLSDYVYLTVSTGIGGAVVSGGRLMRGPDGVAGELGHMTVDIDGPPCGCGARGHLEALASGSAIARAMGVDEASLVAASADAGVQAAVEIMERARQAFAAAAVSIADIFNPQRIIVGGGVAIGQGDRLLEQAREQIRKHAFRRQAERVEVVPAELGDDVGLIGAVALVELAALGDHGDLKNDATGAGAAVLTREPPSHDDGDEMIDQSRAARA